MPPHVHLLSYNVGLTNDQVDPEQSMTSIFYKFTTQLKDVIQWMFTYGADTPAPDRPSRPAHVVFLCELGSQKK